MQIVRQVFYRVFTLQLCLPSPQLPPLSLPVLHTLLFCGCCMVRCSFCPHQAASAKGPGPRPPRAQPLTSINCTHPSQGAAPVRHVASPQCRSALQTWGLCLGTKPPRQTHRQGKESSRFPEPATATEAPPHSYKPQLVQL